MQQDIDDHTRRLLVFWAAARDFPASDQIVIQQCIANCVLQLLFCTRARDGNGATRAQWEIEARLEEGGEEEFVLLRDRQKRRGMI